jgi:adenine-specific DNA-methyltransferase
MDLIERTEARRTTVSEQLDDKRRSGLGQFFTPAITADFIVSLLDLPESGPWRVLDPGAGVGSLSAALVARLIREGSAAAVRLVAFEVDEPLLPHLQATLDDCEAVAREAGVTLTTELRAADFVAWSSENLGQMTMESSGRFERSHEAWDAVVMNPPYRKVSTASDERRALERAGITASNLYAGFLALSAAQLSPDGQLVAITPRSFANGPYFRDFRRFFLERVALRRLHVFESRADVFRDTSVLQENVVFHATRKSAEQITLSVSAGYRDEPVCRDVDYDQVVNPADPNLLVHIPVDEHATAVAEAIAAQVATLPALDVKVSTGRVVDFRSHKHLLNDLADDSVPLIYPQHLRGGHVTWPLGGKKADALRRCADTESLLLPAGHYVVVKRFTAKEERRRVVAVVISPDDFPDGTEVYAIENHLNVYHRRSAGLPAQLAAGLAAYLNSTTVDDYVRQFSGHTQINATDLRMLRYPSEEQLIDIGQQILAGASVGSQEDIDGVVDDLFATDRSRATSPGGEPLSYA